MTVLRLLWARRLLVGAGFLVAVLVAVLMTYSVSLSVPPQLERKQHVIGQASAQVLIDTPNSQIADMSPDVDPSALYTRASLLADLMATAPAQQEIASQLGIPLWNLAVTPPATSIAVPIKATPLAVAGTRVGGPSQWQLAVNIDPNLPIIAFSAVAPTPAQAGQLTNAAIAVLRERLTVALAGHKLPPFQQVVVNVVDPTRTGTLVTGSRKLYGLAAAVIVFSLICFLIVVVTGVRRRTEDLDTRQDPEEIVPEPAPITIAKPAQPRMATMRRQSASPSKPSPNGHAAAVSKSKRTQRARNGAAG